MSTLDLKQINIANIANTAMTSLTCDDNGKVLMDGEEVVDLSEFGSSLTGNGWQRLPSGLIVQWGVYATGAGSGTISFPISFPTERTRVSFSPHGTSNTNYTSVIEVDGVPASLSSFDFIRSGQQGRFTWFCIGW